MQIDEFLKESDGFPSGIWSKEPLPGNPSPWHKTWSHSGKHGSSPRAPWSWAPRGLMLVHNSWAGSMLSWMALSLMSWAWIPGSASKGNNLCSLRRQQYLLSQEATMSALSRSNNVYSVKKQQWLLSQEATMSALSTRNSVLCPQGAVSGLSTGNRVCSVNI